jgi:hypothetical protein
MSSANEMAVNFTAAFVSGFCGVMAMNPIETTMIRYQMSPNVKVGIITFGKQIIASEGLIRGLWTPGIFAHGFTAGLSGIGRIGLYPTIRDSMLKLFGAAPGEKPYSAMVAAGAVSGAFGYFFCCPIY